MPSEKYEDFLELSVKQFVIQPNPISLGQINITTVSSKVIYIGIFCTTPELCRSKCIPISFKR